MSDRSSSSSSVGTYPVSAGVVARRVDDLHVEAVGPLGDRSTDAPEAHEPEGRAVHVTGQVVPNPQPFHLPSRRSRSASVARRVAARIRRNARSAVVSSSTPGVLQTVMPRSACAAATSMLS